MATEQQESVEGEVKDKVVSINRVTKVVKGGRRFSFSALVVAGDGKGRVGIGLGKASEVPDAIQKANDQARKSLVNVTVVGTTIPFEVSANFGAATVLLRPAPEGTGIIAGGPVRALSELAGIKNIVTKCHGTSNAHNVVKAALKAFGMLESQEAIAKRRKNAENL